MDKTDWSLYALQHFVGSFSFFLSLSVDFTPHTRLEEGTAANDGNCAFVLTKNIEPALRCPYSYECKCDGIHCAADKRPATAEIGNGRHRSRYCCCMLEGIARRQQTRSSLGSLKKVEQRSVGDKGEHGGSEKTCTVPSLL